MKKKHLLKYIVKLFPLNTLFIEFCNNKGIGTRLRLYFLSILTYLILTFAGGGCSVKTDKDTVNTAKPWAYWWWMGSSVTKDGIDKNLEAYSKAGMGGLHIIPIYGEKGDETNYIEYLSPKWMQMLVHTVSKAKELGLGIDMTMGTGWPFGGPEITPDIAAKDFRLIEIENSGNMNTRDVVKGIEGGLIVSLAGLNEKGTCDDITALIQENQTIKIPEKYKKAYALVMKPDGMKVKRAAPGGKGLVMDFFNREALDVYTKKFEKVFAETNFPSGKVRAFYNDSYEVHNANFTPHFLEEFNRLRGYSLTNYLNIIADTSRTEYRERIVSDYCETISDLLYSEFTTNWVKKCHKLGMITRNQAHGSPANILDLYGLADTPETESFGASDFHIPGLRKDADFDPGNFGRPNPLVMKFASSAAHIKNRQLVASETATWLGDHFKVALSQVKPQIDELFTAGINHIFYHGITYNPPEKPFPGRLFYASTNFGIKSHFWNELPALNKYVERCQAILQNTRPDNDVLVYFPIHDIWAKSSNDKLILSFDVHKPGKWMGGTGFEKVISQLQAEGFSFDYVSDRMLAEAGVNDKKIQFEGGTYKAIVVPNCKYISLKTMENLQRLVKSGATVIFQDEMPVKAAGFNNVESRQNALEAIERELKSRVKIAVNISSELLKYGILNEKLAKSGLSFIRKKEEGTTVYFISNLSDKFHSGNIKLSVKASSVEIYDPFNGKKGLVESNIEGYKTVVYLQLKPGQSCFLRCTSDVLNEGKWTYYSSAGVTIPVNPEWTITPTSGAPELPKPVKTWQLQSWTRFGNGYDLYSGKAMYSAIFSIDKKYLDRRFLLDLGDVRETAKVTINGHDLGLLWCVPYQVIVPENYLKQTNEIEIEVTNLSFNRVIDLDRKGVQWKNFNEINFVNIRYEPFDASNKKPVESGLLGDIKLILLAYE